MVLIAALAWAASASMGASSPKPIQYVPQYQYSPTGYQYYQPPKSLVVDPNGGDKYYGRLNDQVNTQGPGQAMGSDGPPRKAGR
jgi:hypothetical protein